MKRQPIYEDLDSPSEPVKQPFGTGTTPLSKPPLTNDEILAKNAAADAEYAARRTSLAAQAALALDPNAPPESKRRAAEVLKVYRRGIEEFVQSNPECHPDSPETDLSARFDCWFELDVLLG
jgi:hypothetical protein